MKKCSRQDWNSETPTTNVLYAFKVISSKNDFGISNAILGREATARHSRNCSHKVPIKIVHVPPQFNKGEKGMKAKLLTVLETILALSTVGFAQDVVSDVGRSARATGRVTEKAATKTAHGTVKAAKATVHGGEKAASETGRGTEKAVKGTEKAAKVTARGGEKVAGGAEKTAAKTGHGVKTGAEDVGHGVKKVATKTVDAVK
jgi:hypothetical protein